MCAFLYFRDWAALRSLTGLNMSGWKYQDSFYGNFSVGRRPSMDTAWGRRVYDQYEIEFPVDTPRNKYLVAATTEAEENKVEPRELGLWDLIFSREIIPKLEGKMRYCGLSDDHHIDVPRRPPKVGSSIRG